MGPSGAGKSTLLSVLMGTPSGADFQGQVWINGRVMKVSRLRRIMGYVPQVDPASFNVCLQPMQLLENTGRRFWYHIEGKTGSTRKATRIGVLDCRI